MSFPRFGFQHLAVFALASGSAILASTGSSPVEVAELVALNIGVIAAFRFSASRQPEPQPIRVRA